MVLRSRAVAALGWLVTVVVVGGWFAYLRPPALGGSTSYVFVRGDSMEPTYAPGDLAVVRPTTRYQVGDVIAFRPPDSRATVIHRIVGGEEGAFRMQGDNRSVEDPWQPDAGDVVGRAVVQVPRAGAVLARVQQPALLGAVCATIAFFSVVGRPRLRRGEPGHQEDIVPVLT